MAPVTAAGVTLMTEKPRTRDRPLATRGAPLATEPGRTCSGAPREAGRWGQGHGRGGLQCCFRAESPQHLGNKTFEPTPQIPWTPREAGREGLRHGRNLRQFPNPLTDKTREIL